jgi:uncharacterized protein YhaN
MDYSLHTAAPAVAHNDLLILAAIFIVFLGAMMTPVVLSLARPIQPTVERLARQAAWNACKAALARVVGWLAAVATAGAALSILVAVMATPANAQSPLDKAQTAITKSIERMIGIMDKVAKNPVVQGAKVVTRGFMAVKVYRLSKEVKGLKTDVVALQASLHAILTEVTGVIARIEAGEELTAAELDAINVRIDVHAVQIAAAEAEIEVLKLRMDEAERTARQIERQQREQDQRQRAVEHQQREAAVRQRETDERQRKTDANVASQKQRISRSAKGEFGHYDAKCNCRRDVRERDRDDGQPTAFAVK